MSIDAMKQALDWAYNHGEAVFAGGGMKAVAAMDAWAVAMRLAIEQAERQEPALKPCWYESKEKTMCRKCGQVHAEAILPNQEKQEPVAWGVPNTRITERQPFMMLLHSTEGCQYPEMLVPLYTAPPQRQPLTEEEA